MFGWGAFDNLQQIQQAQNPEFAARREAELLIEEKGVGVCQFCGYDIVKNNDMTGGGWTWESEFLVGFCDKSAKGGKHSPIVVWKPVTVEEHHGD